ncbi:sporulation related protein [Maritalea mobilis]|uniref:Sporulation related protein n=1 Tax=Maritalea mobilis TaxID=483324 RepID=A0A4R6VQD6_9HYPH|nr:SPOR domain-containing protein [Maritalea mobilis]TDQ66223.1 sporulation related protein [Maritalea mobilis]
MADSKKPADQGLDQSDDLIAELARIVADDAKRASVSQSIEQRAQQERPVEPSRPAASSSGQTGAAPMSAFSGQQDRQQQNQQQRQEPTFSAPAEPKQAETEKAADPFEFDFASSYRESAAAQSTQSTAQDALDRIENAQNDFSAEVEQLVAEAEQEQRPEPIAPETQTREQRQSAEALKQEVNAAAAVDEIADLISKADEAEETGASYAEPSAPAPVEPKYDHESDALFAEEPYMQAQEEPAPQPQQAPAAPVRSTPEQPAPTAPAQPQQPAAQQTQTSAYDPLAEIERLIEDTSDGRPSRSHHSYLDSQSSTEQPTASSKDDSSNAAEAAILAAMAAARPSSEPAEAPRAQAPVGPAPEAAPTAAAAASQKPTAPYLNADDQRASYEEVEPKPETNKERSKHLPLYAGGLAAILLLALGGMTLWNFIGGGQTDGDVPLVTAQNTDVKQTPETTDTGEESPSVFSALEGQPEDTSSEQLVSRDDTQGASGEGVSRVITPSNTGESSSGLTNRKVKTVTVLADGTIVTGDEASAGAQQLPDIRPNVPAVSGSQTGEATTSTDPIGDAIADAQATTPDSSTETATTDQTTTDEPATTEEDSTAQIDETAPTPPARPAGLGTDQPLASAVLNNSVPTNGSTDSNDQPLGLVPNSQPATSTPAPQTSSAPVNASTNEVNAPFYVQLASQRTAADAQSTVTTVTRQFGSALGGQTVGVNRVDLGDRGIFYRVLVPANSIEAANAICNNVKVAGGDCFVRNN